VLESSERSRDIGGTSNHSLRGRFVVWEEDTVKVSIVYSSQSKSDEALLPDLLVVQNAKTP